VRERNARDIDEHIARLAALPRQRIRQSDRRSPWMKVGMASAIVIAVSTAVLIRRNVTLSSAGTGNSVVHAGRDTASPGLKAAQPGEKNASGSQAELIKSGGVGDSKTAKPLGPQQERQFKVPTLIHFESSPSPAKVVVDDDESLSCQTPCYLPLPPGRHTSVVSAPRYFLARRIIQVPSETSSFVSLSENIQTVQISSNPVGSTLYIDGDAKGQTPLTLHLSVGQHKIRLEKADLKYEDDLEVKSGDFQHFFITLGSKKTP